MSKINLIKWLKIGREDTSCFIYAEIQIANEKSLIRFAIDKKTLNGFETALRQKPFKENTDLIPHIGIPAILQIIRKMVLCITLKSNLEQCGTKQRFNALNFFVRI